MSKLRPVNERGYVIGEHHHRARLTDEQVDAILFLRFEVGLTYRQIVAKFDDPGEFRPAVSTVRDICQGRRRQQLPSGMKA